MIFISDAANGHSLGWLQDLDRDARHSGGNTAFKKALAAEALPTTQINLEVGDSAEQQSTRNGLLAQQSAQVSGAATALSNAQQYFAAQAAASPTGAEDSDLERDPRSIMAEFRYQNDTGEWVTDQIELKTNFDMDFKGAVTPQDQTQALLSVLNSLVYGIPLSDEAKELIGSESSFMGLLGLDPDELSYAKEHPDYVLNTPLGKMTYGDLEQLSKRIYNFVDNPSLTTRMAALETFQAIAERSDELNQKWAQQTPFAELKTQVAATQSAPSEQAAEQKTAQQTAQQAAQQATVAYREAQHDLKEQINQLKSAEHEAQQDFLNNLQRSHELLRS